MDLQTLGAESNSQKSPALARGRSHMGNVSLHVMRIINLLFFFAATMNAAALDAVARIDEPVEGVRIFTCAHSFHVFVPALLADIAKSAGITNQVQLGVSYIGGSQVIQHWEKPDDQNLAKHFLRAGQVDVLTLSPIWLPDPGIEKFGEFAVAYNPRIRILVQEFWLPNDVYDPVYPLKTHEKVDHNAATIPALKKQQDLYCQEMRQYLDGLNSKLGKNTFFLVPVGHAVIALRDKIIKHEAPGLNTQEDLFRDNWGHPQEPVRLLDAYCFFACIYHRSPVGLPPPANLKGKWDPKLIRLLQELAWDAVTHHPLTGFQENQQSLSTSIHHH
jgi:hypothetical protein